VAARVGAVHGGLWTVDGGQTANARFVKPRAGHGRVETPSGAKARTPGDAYAGLKAPLFHRYSGLPARRGPLRGIPFRLLPTTEGRRPLLPTTKDQRPTTALKTPVKGSFLPISR